MIKQIRTWLQNIGLSKSSYSIPVSPYNPDDYTGTNDKDKLILHRDYLRTLEDDENSRMNLIEGKAAQMISQTGLIFSLLSLFIPLLIDKVGGFHFVVKLICFGLLISAFFFYMLTINNSLKNMNVRKFMYARPAAVNVIKLQNDTLEEFYLKEIQDLLVSIHRNQHVNNHKATNLIRSFTTFRIGNLLTGLLVGLLCLILLSQKSEQPSIQIKNPIAIQHFDSGVNVIVSELKRHKDTVLVITPAATIVKPVKRTK